MSSPLITLLQDQDPDSLVALLADGVRFHSPVADYEGRADVAHLFTLIGSVLRDVETDREVEDGATRTTFFRGSAESRPLQGILDEHYDDSGRLTEATLMLRPLSSLHVAVSAMAAALAESPLPSAR